MSLYIRIGQDVRISPQCTITRGELVELGNHIAIDTGFYCTTKLVVGDYVHISPYVCVIGGKTASMVVEDFCFISVGAKMICGSEMFHGDGLVGPLIPDKYKDKQNIGTITMERFSGVCAAGVVMPGVTMAEGSVLGANSFLKNDTQPWTIYAGNPAVPIKTRKKENMYSCAKELGYIYGVR